MTSILRAYSEKFPFTFFFFTMYPSGLGFRSSECSGYRHLPVTTLLCGEWRNNSRFASNLLLLQRANALVLQLTKRFLTSLSATRNFRKLCFALEQGNLYARNLCNLINNGEVLREVTNIEQTEWLAICNGHNERGISSVHCLHLTQALRRRPFLI